MSGLLLQATTGVNGFALTDSTPDILTWNVPDDGQLHRALAVFIMDVTTAQTGGGLNLLYTLPNGSAQTFGILAGSQGAGYNYSNYGAVVVPVFAKAGTAVTFAQASAQTAGAAVVWAELWGS